MDILEFKSLALEVVGVNVLTGELTPVQMSTFKPDEYKKYVNNVLKLYKEYNESLECIKKCNEMFLEMKNAIDKYNEKMKK